MSTQRLLQVLAQQIAALAAEVTPRGDAPIPQARFDVALFANRGTRLRDYLAEVEKTSPSCKTPLTTAAPARWPFWPKNWLPKSLPCSASWQPRRYGARISRKKPPGRSVPQAGRASGLRTPADRHDSGSGKPAGAPDHVGGAAKAAARAGGAGGETDALPSGAGAHRAQYRAQRKRFLKIYHNILMIIPGCAPGSLYSAETRVFHPIN